MRYQIPNRLLLFCLTVLLCALLGQVKAQTIPTDSLIAFYLFSGNADDASRNGCHGVLGATDTSALPILIPDRYGTPNSAYRFGGQSNPNYIRIPYNSSFDFSDNNLSISAWVKRDSFDNFALLSDLRSNQPGAIFSQMKPGYGWGYGLSIGDWVDSSSPAPQSCVDFRIAKKNGNGDIIVYHYTPRYRCIENTDWVHYVVVHDGSNNMYTVYINGQKKSIDITRLVSLNNNRGSDLYIGIKNDPAHGFESCYPGAIDDVAIYNRALTDEDVRQLMGDYFDDKPWLLGVNVEQIEKQQPTCGFSDGSINITASHYFGPYLYAITTEGSALDSSTFQPTGLFENLPAGQYRIHISSNCGDIDTLVELRSSVNTRDTLFIETCDSFYWADNETWYNHSVIDSILTTNNLGCDSVSYLNLTLHYSQKVTLADTFHVGIPYHFGEHGITQPGVYHHIFQTQWGCDSAVTYILWKAPEPPLPLPEAVLFVPNIITPSQPINNQFHVTVGNGGHITDYTLQIFTRGGNRIFESHDVNQNWDATYHGHLCKADAYVYRITYRDAADPSAKRQCLTGLVTVVR